jgi:hypothetical protein
LTAALASAPALSGCGQATQPAQPRDDGSQVVQSAPVGPADEAGAATEADPAPEDPAEADPDQADPDQAGGDPGDGGAGGDPAASFDILGKWKVVGGSGYGQAQANAIVQFAPESVNLFSPQDTWAVYEEGGALKLTVTGLLGGGSTFVVTVTDDDNIELATGGANVVLRRVG